MNEVMYLQPLRNLRALSLSENPISSVPGYRPFVIKCLPQLEKLDNQPVTAEDKMKAESIDIDDFDTSQPQQKMSPPRQNQVPS